MCSPSSDSDSDSDRGRDSDSDHDSGRDSGRAGSVRTVSVYVLHCML